MNHLTLCHKPFLSPSKDIFIVHVPVPLPPSATPSTQQNLSNTMTDLSLCATFVLRSRLIPIKAGYVLYDFLRVGVGEHIPGEEKKAD